MMRLLPLLLCVLVPFGPIACRHASTAGDEEASNLGVTAGVGTGAAEAAPLRAATSLAATLDEPSVEDLRGRFEVIEGQRTLFLWGPLPKGITVNAVCPGFVDTAIVENAARTISERSGRPESDARDLLAAQNPLGRLVTPAEVAAAVLYLVSDGSGAISGHQMVLDGGTQVG